MSARRVLASTALAVLGAAVLVPTPAGAERDTVVDMPGDAQKLDWERSRKNDPVFLPAPDETSVDVVRTVVAHGETRLGVTVRYRELVRASDHETSIRVLTSHERRFDVRITLTSRGRAETALTRDDRFFSCPGLRPVVDVARHRVKVSLPTSCLGEPRWVRVGVVAEGLEDVATEEHPYDFEMYLDDGGSAGLGAARSWPSLGPRVRRG